MGDPVTLSLNLTPFELMLAQALVNEKIAQLDKTYARLRRLSEEADAFTITHDGEETNRLVRGVYAKMQHQIAQLLETPFIDIDDVAAAVLAVAS